jgi:hypothetical protein
MPRTAATGLARALGGTQRQVRLAEQVVAVGGIGGCGYADPELHRDYAVAEHERCREARHDLVHEALDLRDVGRVFDDHAELVRAQAGHRAALAHRRHQALTDRDQELVADAVSHGVTGDLEVVHVAHQDAGRRPGAVGLRRGPLDRVLEPEPVAEAGQRVEVCPAQELPLQPLALGDVA